MVYWQNDKFHCVNYTVQELLQKKYSGSKSDWILWLESLNDIELFYVRGILPYDNDVFWILMKKLRTCS